MSAYDEFLTHYQKIKLQSAAGPTFASVWTGLTPQERTDLVLLVMRKPEEGGKRIRELIIQYIQTVTKAELDAFFAKSSVTPAEIRAFFGG